MTMISIAMCEIDLSQKQQRWSPRSIQPQNAHNWLCRGAHASANMSCLFYHHHGVWASPPPPATITPFSEQHEVVFPQLIELWNLAVPFPGCP
jgi:hypothetical protein